MLRHSLSKLRLWLPKQLIWALILSTGLLFSTVNGHIHLDQDALSCDICLLSNLHGPAVDTNPVKLPPAPSLPFTPTPVSLPLLQAILGFLIRGPPVLSK